MQLDRSKLKQSLSRDQELLAERIVKALENLDINSRNTTRFGILYPKARLYSDPLRIEFKVEIDDGHSTSVLIGHTIAFSDEVLRGEKIAREIVDVIYEEFNLNNRKIEKGQEEISGLQRSFVGRSRVESPVNWLLGRLSSRMRRDKAPPRLLNSL